MRVYIRFIPPRTWLQPMRLPQDMTLAEASEPILKTAEIMVNCRLVKDYSKVILLKASCRQPQINISQSDFTFPGTITKNELPGVDADRQWNVDFTTDSDILTITNILRDPLEYTIMSDSMYFAYENEDAMRLSDGKPWVLLSNERHRIRIRPRLDVILKHVDFLRKASLGLDRSFNNFRNDTFSNTLQFTTVNDLLKNIGYPSNFVWAICCSFRLVLPSI